MPHPYERAIAYVATLATGEPVDPSLRVTLHFHPDRLVAATAILRLMARDRRYRSQFETGTGNGGLTRVAGWRPLAVGAPHLRRRVRRWAGNLGVSLARGGRLDARVIGDASRDGRYDEHVLKRVWHYVARFGNAEMRAPRPGERTAADQPPESSISAPTGTASSSRSASQP